MGLAQSHLLAAAGGWSRRDGIGNATSRVSPCRPGTYAGVGLCVVQVIILLHSIPICYWSYSKPTIFVCLHGFQRTCVSAHFEYSWQEGKK